jgi:HSP20 family molecular chaperone IbpA
MTETTNMQTTQNPVSAAAKGADAMPLELSPAVDIIESKEGVTLLIDLPGVSKEHLDIDVDKNVLTIKGAINLHTDETLNATYMDVHAGVFTRQFTLGSELDAAAIDANLKDGVLKLFVPRSEQHKPRKIEIKTG